MEKNHMRASIFTFAFVVRTDVDTIDSLRDFLEQNNVVVCYQKVSGDKLYITAQESIIHE